NSFAFGICLFAFLHPVFAQKTVAYSYDPAGGFICVSAHCPARGSRTACLRHADWVDFTSPDNFDWSCVFHPRLYGPAYSEMAFFHSRIRGKRSLFFICHKQHRKFYGLARISISHGTAHASSPSKAIVVSAVSCFCDLHKCLHDLDVEKFSG